MSLKATESKKPDCC